MDTGIVLGVLDDFIAYGAHSFAPNFSQTDQPVAPQAPVAQSAIELKPKRGFTRCLLLDGKKTRILIPSTAVEGSYVDEDLRIQALEDDLPPPEPIPFLQWAVQIGPRKVNFYVRGKNPVQWRGKMLDANFQVWSKTADDAEKSVYFYIDLHPTQILPDEPVHRFEVFQRDPPPGLNTNLFRTHTKSGGFVFVLDFYSKATHQPTAEQLGDMALQRGWTISSKKRRR